MADSLVRMGRKKKPDTEPAPAGDDSPKATGTVRIEGDLVEMLSIISIRRRTSVSDLVSPKLRPWVETLFAEVTEEMHNQTKKRT